MSYVTSSLSQGEEIKLRAHLHWHCFLDEWFFTLVTVFLIWIYDIVQPVLTEPAVNYGFIGFIALDVLWILNKWIDVLSVDMVVTNRRVIYKKGFFSLVTSEILISRIEAISIEQSPMGLVFGFADLHFSGTGTAHVAFYNIAKPHKVKSEIEYIISQQERR
ncbi:MAG: PH domain-containing protein [Alphaproteobacteria bacterium]|nr:PH domain-containing protein [Alphaproteobacteria bacterium]